MKLLICTQAVDRDDPALGFFHEWIAQIVKKSDKVTVICLRKGSFDLPGVEVIALGERARFLRAIELLSIASGRRRDYDVVFVHMNPEYVVAAGWLWRLMGKKVSLWYTHKAADMKLRIAHVFANVIFTASKESFRMQSKKVHIMGHGIDTDFFFPDASSVRGRHLLSAGRLMQSKRHDIAIRVAALTGRELRIAGEGSEEASLKELARKLGARVTFLGPLSQTQLRDEYRTAAHFLHMSETGSMDKVVLEALACDCDVITTTQNLFAGFPVRSVGDVPEAIAEAISGHQPTFKNRASIIRERHALPSLIQKILWTLTQNK